MEEMKNDLDEDIVAWLTLDAETVNELMSCLDETDTWRDPVKVKFIENPYTMPLIFQSSPSYVTINGNEESCGSSFSDSESSVMASVDVSGIVNVSGGAWGTHEEEALTVFDQETEGT